MIVGLSTHTPEQAKEALAAGADYIGVGPIYPTQTKKDVCAPVTLEYLDWVVANIDLPFVAIGGIKRHNIGEVMRHGARCCALVSELVGAPGHPGQSRGSSRRHALEHMTARPICLTFGSGGPIYTPFSSFRSVRNHQGMIFRRGFRRAGFRLKRT